MSVGENIKRIREARGLKQYQLSDRVGVTQACICRAESGLCDPSLKLSKRIAEALGCTIEDFFADDPVE